MSMTDLEQAFELIEANESLADFEGAKSVDLIEAGETALQLKFPPTYRAFLERYGCGDINGLEIFGIIKGDFENSSIPDAVWLTLDERRNSDLPSNLVLVCETGEGSYYAVNLGESNSDGDSPVVEWAADNSSLLPVAEDFGVFLREQLQTVLA